MIILNDPIFSDELFMEISSKEELEKLSAGVTPLFIFNQNDLELYKFCKENSIPYAVEVHDLLDYIFVSNLGAKYAIVDSIIFGLPRKLQQIADSYLLETKVIMPIGDYSEIPNWINSEIDGVIINYYEIIGRSNE
jgi:hypothetical protein